MIIVQMFNCTLMYILEMQIKWKPHSYLFINSCPMVRLPYVMYDMVTSFSFFSRKSNTKNSFVVVINNYSFLNDWRHLYQSKRILLRINPDVIMCLTVIFLYSYKFKFTSICLMNTNSFWINACWYMVVTSY